MARALKPPRDRGGLRVRCFVHHVAGIQQIRPVESYRRGSPRDRRVRLCRSHRAGDHSRLVPKLGSAQAGRYPIRETVPRSLASLDSRACWSTLRLAELTAKVYRCHQCRHVWGSTEIAIQQKPSSHPSTPRRRKPPKTP